MVEVGHNSSSNDYVGIKQAGIEKKKELPRIIIIIILATKEKKPKGGPRPPCRSSRTERQAGRQMADTIKSQQMQCNPAGSLKSISGATYTRPSPGPQSRDSRLGCLAPPCLDS